MRIALTSLVILVLVPNVALADGGQQIAPDVVLTIEDPTVAQPKPRVEQPRVEQPRKVEPPKNTGGYVVPERVPYEGGRVPADAVIEKQPNMMLVGTGVGIAGTAYLVSVITALAACPPQSTCTTTKNAGWLYMPLVGPFITAATGGSDGGRALAAFDGGVQVLGASIALAGVLAPKKLVVWQSKSASLKISPNLGGVSLTLTHL